MDISIIIPTYNRLKCLRKCLESLLSQTYPKDKFEIIVVNNGGSDKAGKIVKAIGSGYNIRYFYLIKNSGPAAARNLGLKNSDSEIVAFIDDDNVVNRCWIENIVRFHRLFPEEGAIQGGLLNSSEKNFFGLAWKFIFDTYIEKSMVIDEENPKKRYVDVLGGNVSFKKMILEEMAGYNENLGLAEDLDLKYRLQHKGIRVLYAPEISATHFYRSNALSFIRQEFSKGRGIYYLLKIWKDRMKRGPKIRIISMSSFHRLYTRYRIKSAVIFPILFIKTRVNLLGVKYERLIYALKAYYLNLSARIR